MLVHATQGKKVCIFDCTKKLILMTCLKATISKTSYVGNKL